ncbi:chromosomal replication initiator protein DnaA [Clostridium sp. CAG:508]|jgi:chromosomal replication initiator protein|nr:chromosomal replication initiator protein DnaA [Clostridium sp. CAG:508]
MQKAEINELNTKAKELLKTEVTGISYSTWISNIEIFSVDDTTITIMAQNIVHKDMLESRYLSLLKNTFSFITHKNYDVKIICEEDMPKAEAPVIPTNTPNSSNLNPKYTFNSFVVGNNNSFAHAAALAVAEAPATAYNPLFLYGGVGLGKTHLMHAIGNEILKNNKNASVLYVSSEKFTNQFINAIKDNKNEMFRNKYRNIDVLLIDDIQFIAGKERIQEEFFHTFNTLHDDGKQIIISSDRPPKDIQPLEDRLRTRFEWGLIADISNPDYETRMAILKKKAQLDNIIIDDDVLVNIATHIDTNIRELEGALNKLIAYSTLSNSPITIELSNKAISDVVSHHNKVLSIEYIQEVCAKYFNVTVEDLKGSRRSADIAFARQVAMYFCRDVANLSTPKIGLAFGKRDHSTVMHGCNKIANEIKENTNTKLIVETVKNSLFAD